MSIFIGQITNLLKNELGSLNKLKFSLFRNKPSQALTSSQVTYLITALIMRKPCKC